MDRTEKILARFKQILKDTPKKEMDEIIAKIDSINDKGISIFEYVNSIEGELIKEFNGEWENSIAPNFLLSDFISTQNYIDGTLIGDINDSVFPEEIVKDCVQDNSDSQTETFCKAA